MALCAGLGFLAVCVFLAVVWYCGTVRERNLRRFRQMRTARNAPFVPEGHICTRLSLWYGAVHAQMKMKQFGLWSEIPHEICAQDLEIPHESEL
jgi:hypothetical protein